MGSEMCIRDSKYWRPVSDRRRHFRQVVQCAYPYFIWDTPHIPVPGFWGVRPVLPLTKGFDLLPIRIQLFKSANLEQNRAITVCIVIGIGQLSQPIARRFWSLRLFANRMYFSAVGQAINAGMPFV